MNSAYTLLWIHLAFPCFLCCCNLVIMLTLQNLFQFFFIILTACDLSCVHQESQTDGLLLEGGHTWTPTMFIRLVQDFGLESEVAKHLAHTYGDRAFSVAKLASLTGQRWPIGNYTLLSCILMKHSEHTWENISKIPIEI